MFWKNQEESGEMTSLCKLAKRVLCATPTTAAFERTFSTAGFIFNNRRSRLSDTRFEHLLFNNLNGDLRSFRARVEAFQIDRKRKITEVDN